MLPEFSDGIRLLSAVLNANTHTEAQPTGDGSCYANQNILRLVKMRWSIIHTDFQCGIDLNRKLNLWQCYCSCSNQIRKQTSASHRVGLASKINWFSMSNNTIHSIYTYIHRNSILENCVFRLFFHLFVLLGFVYFFFVKSMIVYFKATKQVSNTFPSKWTNYYWLRFSFRSKPINPHQTVLEMILLHMCPQQTTSHNW